MEKRLHYKKFLKTFEETLRPKYFISVCSYCNYPFYEPLCLSSCIAKFLTCIQHATGYTRASISGI